jgi:RsiW-degrading membrane proteinase PrsW (M82 family)
MMINYILSLALAPVLAIFTLGLIWIKRGKDRYPGLITSFILGMVSIVLVVLFQYISRQFGLEDFKNLRRIIFYSFIVMGFGSEFGKFLILRYYNYSKSSFNGPLDSIVYSIMISLGFSLMSNVIYFALPYYAEIDFTYAYSVIFANLFFAIILGFYTGMAKVRENKFVDSMTGLLGASFFHALYNFCFITKDFRLLLFLSIGAFIIIIMLYYKAFELNEEFKRLKKE